LAALVFLSLFSFALCLSHKENNSRRSREWLEFLASTEWAREQRLKAEDIVLYRSQEKTGS
jgi:hypothetical protein